MNVLITGNNRGLGRVLSAAFKEKGHNVFGTSRTAHGDLRDPKTMEQLYLLSENNSIDLLINSAALYSDKFLLEYSDKEVFDFFAVNVLAPITLTKRLWPILSKNRGIVININSVAGRIPFFGNEFFYRVTKSSLFSFSCCLGYQGIKDGVRVIDIPLGAMHVGMAIARPVRGGFPRSPEEAADVLFSLLENKRIDSSHPLICGSIIDNFAFMPGVNNGRS